MYTTVPMEAGFFLASIGAGAFVAFLYDLLRISRRILETKDFAVNIEDVLFLAVSSLILFYVAYKKNSGEIRWHGFIGFGVGIGLYILIVGNRLLNTGTLLIKWLIRVLEKTIKILLFPVKVIFRLFKKPVSFIMWYTCRGVSRAKCITRRGRDRLGIRLKNAVFMLRKK